ncbi:MAG: helix-turn-helix domain-containing protein [Bacteroidales bacterium]|nr:helix-turn-helix domain-containing protein [Bacteroidales bacterium]
MLSLLLLSVLLPAACGPMEKTVPVERTEDGVPVFPLVIERLPDLGVPRQTGMVVTLGDTVLVMGGHTTGFIPVSTAEYFSAGSWHQIPMLYPHDGGFSVLLPDGRVMAGGGHDKPFGVGGSLGVEVFDPVSCRFTPVGILKHRRSLASALAFPDGQVLVCGNWYEEDSIEIYEPGIGFSEAAPFQEGHSCPVLIPSDDGEILVFSSCDCFGNSSSGAVERLYGEPLYPDVLREWRPSGANGASSCSLGGGNYLLPIVSKKDSISSISPSWRILKVSGTDFSLLETDFPIPRQTPDGASINWYGTLLADKDTRMAYMPGIDDEARFHLLRLNYDPALVGAPAELSLFSTRESVGTVYSEMATALLPDGRIMLCGGIAGNNFEPQSSAFLLHTAALSPRPLRWLLPLVLVVASGGFSIFLLRRRRRVKQEASRESEADIRERTDLMTRIDHLMEREELFRRKDLHLADVARAIGTNTTYFSACINGQWGGSFSDYITRYRVEYAKKLMKEHPDMLIETVLELSGFANESSFYRTFKACTGQTPSEWKNA